MCGRLNITDDPAVVALCEALGLTLWPESEHLEQQQTLRFERFVRASDTIAFICQQGEQRRLLQATWWLLLDETSTGFTPSRYTSFNTRYDKLNVPHSAGFRAYRSARCIIPVKGFGETEGKGKSTVYTDFSAAHGEALALGGLYRQWQHSQTGEHMYSCSVITLPPHPKLHAYHSKSSPLILPQDDATLAMWLSPTIQDVRVFDHLLKAHLPQPLVATHIDKPSTYNSLSAPVTITADPR
ncbi:MAG: SOS response-associated peptidase [Paraglaciecola sp.]|nr:SOS response-associated peptidase [Paraglaciecola sp.]